MADEPAAPGTVSSAGTPAATDNSQGSGNSEGAENPQTPVNPQPPNTPLLPQPGANPYLPYSPASSSYSNGQAPQITTPGLYTTGGNDLSQVATNAALTQAFSQQAVSGFSSEEGIGYSYPPIERIRLGPFDLKAAISMNLVSDDNLRVNGTTGAKMSDTSFGVTPAVLLEYGAQEGEKGYVSLVYAPTITRFFHYSDQNSDNQNVALNVTYPFQRLTLDFAQTYTQVSGVNQDLNARTTQTSSVTTFGGSYAIDDKLSFSSHVQEFITSYSGGGGEGSGIQQGQGDTTSSINSSLMYRLSAKMTLGPSFNVGLDKPQDAKQATYEQALLGVNYQPTEKISLFAQSGVEFRQGGQYNQAGPGNQSGDTTNPIFSAGIGYTPFDSTSLSLSASQSVYASSAVSTQTVVSTGVGFSATQRFLQRFYLNFNFNYNHNDNQYGSNGTTGISTTAGGSQDTLLYRPSLTFAPTAWTSVAIYYQYLDNESNAPGGSYYDNQMGISVSAQF